MWLRLSRHNTMISIPDRLVRYRVQSGSMSDDPQRMLDNRLAVLQKVQAAEPELSPERIRRARACAYRAAAIEWLQAGDENQAAHCLKQAADLDPTLMLERITHYELAMWDQARGERGNVQALDMDLNEARLLRLVQAILPELDGDMSQSTYRSKVMATAHRTLGQIRYARRELPQARSHFARAARLQPGIVTNRQMSSLWLKSLLGQRLLPREDVGVGCAFSLSHPSTRRMKLVGCPRWFTICRNRCACEVTKLPC